jgi:hypothetical protein
VATLASFSKNFLPILFNTASSVGMAERPLLLETISEYAHRSEASRLTALFQNVMKKLLTAASGEADAMLDQAETESTKVPSATIVCGLKLLVYAALSY